MYAWVTPMLLEPGTVLVDSGDKTSEWSHNSGDDVNDTNTYYCGY